MLTPDIFPILAETPPDHRGEIQLTDALRRLRARRPIYAVRFTGHHFDTGEKMGFLKATVDMALARPDLGDAFREYLRGDQALSPPGRWLKITRWTFRTLAARSAGARAPGDGPAVQRLTPLPRVACGGRGGLLKS